MVKVGVPPATVSTVPLPDRPLMVSFLPFRSNVPLSVTSPFPEPPGMTLMPPSWTVPLLITVLPR